MQGGDGGRRRNRVSRERVGDCRPHDQPLRRQQYRSQSHVDVPFGPFIGDEAHLGAFAFGQSS